MKFILTVSISETQLSSCIFVNSHFVSTQGLICLCFLLFDAQVQLTLNKITPIKKETDLFSVFKNILDSKLPQWLIFIEQLKKKKSSWKRRETSLQGLRLQIILFYSACLYKYLFKRNEGLQLLNLKKRKKKKKNNNEAYVLPKHYKSMTLFYLV